MRRNITAVTLVVLGLACTADLAWAETRIRVEAGTKLPVRLERGIGTKDFEKWHSFGPARTVSGTLMQDIVSTDGQVALSAGTHISVAVLEDKRAGHLVGRSKLRVGLYSVSTPDGEVIPIDGYPTKLNHRNVDREGTEHGHRGLLKDPGVDVTAVAIGAAAGFVLAQPSAVVAAYWSPWRGQWFAAGPISWCRRVPSWTLCSAGRYPLFPPARLSKPAALCKPRDGA